MKLPIDVVQRSPLKFGWNWTSDTVIGPKTIYCEEVLPPSTEQAVATLIGIAKQQVVEIEQLREQLKQAQADLETATAPQQTTQTTVTNQPPNSRKR